MNYTMAPSLRESCGEVGAVFVTSNLIFQCTKADNSRLFYTVEKKPYCLDVTCNDNEFQGVADAGAVKDMEGFMDSEGLTCQRIRLRLDDPIFPPEPSTGSSQNNPTEPQTCESGTTSLMDIFAQDEETIESLAKVPVKMKSTCLEKESIDNTYNSSETYNSCQADFGIVEHGMETKCRALDGMYLEIDYKLSCVTPEDTLAFVTVVMDPICASKTYCTPKQRDEFARVHALRAFLFGNDTWDCSVSDLQLEDYAPSASPTTSPAPSVSYQPSAPPTDSPAPTPAPTEGDCIHMSTSVNQTTAIQEMLLKYEVQRDTKTLEKQANPDGSVRYHCNTDLPFAVSRSSVSNNSTNIRRELNPAEESNWCEVVKYVLPGDQDGGSKSMRQICQDNGGMFVEEIFTLHCESMTEGSDFAYGRSYLNKPACRHPSCNGQDVKQILGTEMHWLREAMENESGENVQCVFQNLQLLPGVGNVDGYRADGSLAPKSYITDRCQSESDLFGTNIALYNERQRIRREFRDYTSLDLREICISPDPNLLRCVFNWQPFLEETGSEVPFDKMCADNGGQFVTSSVLTTCSKDGETRDLHMYSRNLPACLGISCSPGQSQLYLSNEGGAWLAGEYERKGWTCQTTMQSVFAPNYVFPEERPPSPAPTRASVQEPLETLSPTEPENVLDNSSFDTPPPTTSASSSTASSASAVTPALWIFPVSVLFQLIHR